MGRKNRSKSKRKRATTPYKPAEAESPEPKSKIHAVYKWVRRFSVGFLFVYSTWSSFLILPPDVDIKYNSAIFPKVEFDLPLRITNNSKFTVYDLKAVCLLNVKFENGGKIKNSVTSSNLTNVLDSDQYTDKLIQVINPGTKPISGTYLVTIQYDYSFLKIHHEESILFRVIIDKNNKVYWLAE